MKVKFKLLGTGAGPGTPSFFCDCPGCREARMKPAFSRTRSGALLLTEAGSILVDTSPDLRLQLVRERVTCVDTIFMTHWHYDHFGGLGELEYYSKLATKQCIPLYLPPSAESEFDRAFPHLREVFDVTPWSFDTTYSFGNAEITPLEACHGIETAGFLVESNGKRLAYFPDTAGLSEASARKVEGADWLICDATFYGDNWFPEAHMSIVQAIQLGQAVKACHTVLTHLSVHYSEPVVNGQLEEVVRRYAGVEIGYDGLEFEM